MTISHIEFRKKSMEGVVENPKLLGLVVVEVNPTELCNRTCSFCPRHDPKNYPNRNLNMSIETARLLDDQLKKYQFGGYICIAGSGEPLLSPNIKSLIDELSDHCLELITNADPILKGKHNIEELLRHGIDRILISDYDNNPELRKFVTDKVIIKETLDDGSDNYEKYGFNNRAGSMFTIDKPIQRPCYIPAYKVFIDWNGDVLLCSHDWSKKTIFGNIHQNDISEIWNSPDFVKLRLDLIAGNRYLHKPCAGCNIKGNIMGKEYSHLWTR